MIKKGDFAVVNNQRVQEILKMIDEILNVYKPKIAHKKIFLGPDFERHGKSTLEEAYNLIERARSCDFSILPDGYLDQIYEPIKEYKRLFEEAIAIDETQEGSAPINERNRVIENIDRHYNKLFEGMRLIPFFRSAHEAVEEVRGTRDETIKTIKSTAAEKGVEPHIVYFKETAEEHAKAAEYWLTRGVVALCLFGLIAIVFAILFFVKAIELRWGSPVLIVIFVIFSICSYTVFFCSKNYFSERHNVIVNKRKAASLLAFPFLVATVKGEGKDAMIQIVSGVSATFFGSSATGFSKIQDIPLPPQMEIIRLIKQLLEKKGS